MGNLLTIHFFILRFDLGPSPTVFISDMNAVYEAYQKDAFLDKPYPESRLFDSIRGTDPEGNRVGIFVTTGQVW